jgi:hypothetical protein
MSMGYETAQPWLAGDALRAGIVRPRSLPSPLTRLGAPEAYRSPFWR